MFYMLGVVLVSEYSSVSVTVLQRAMLISQTG